MSVTVPVLGETSTVYSELVLKKLERKRERGREGGVGQRGKEKARGREIENISSSVIFLQIIRVQPLVSKQSISHWGSARVIGLAHS